MLARVARLPRVVSVASPYGPDGASQVSRNGTIAFQQFGIGLAAAIIIDAFVVRTVLVPALMHRFGRANWWLPAWLDRGLFTLRIEGDAAGPVTRRRCREPAAGRGRGWE
jgi:hypothetical protein